jgi:hypothetical protein
MTTSSYLQQHDLAPSTTTSSYLQPHNLTPSTTTSSYIQQHDLAPSTTTSSYLQQHDLTPSTTTSGSKQNVHHGGRPRKKYSEGGASTKRRIKQEVKNLLSDLVSKYDKISNGEGQELFQDVCDKIPISNKSDNKVLKIVDGLARAYKKEPPGPAGKIRILSTVATVFSNKELKDKFSCNDYQIMQARRQATEYGPAVSPPKGNKFVTKYKIPFEDLVFLLHFLHHPDSTDPSSH